MSFSFYTVKKASFNTNLKKNKSCLNIPNFLKKSLGSTISTDKSSGSFSSSKGRQSIKTKFWKAINEYNDKKNKSSLRLSSLKEDAKSRKLRKRILLNDISCQMKSEYLNKTKRLIGDYDNSKLRPKFVDVNNFRHKIINNYVNGTTREEIEHSKVNYKKIIQYMELEKEYKKKSVIAESERFYEIKNGGSIDKSPGNSYFYFRNLEDRNMNHITTNTSFNGENEEYVKERVKYIYNKRLERIKKRSKEYADSFRYLGDEYEELDEKTGKIDPYRINYHNLNRFINVQILQKYHYDACNDYLCEKSARALKNYGKQVEYSVVQGRKQKLKNSQRKFNSNTMTKFKGITGKYFGIPV